MPQSFLGPNPGTVIRDAAEPVILNQTLTANVNGSWVPVDRPGKVVAVAELGSITGTGVSVALTLEGADDASGGNIVRHGRFANIDNASSNQVRVLAVHAYKPFMRVAATVSGTSPSVPVKVVLRPQDYWQGDKKTA